VAGAVRSADLGAALTLALHGIIRLHPSPTMNGTPVNPTPVTTSVERLDEVSVRLRVEAAPDRVRTLFDRAARTLAKDVQIPGFRRGKAPRRVVEQRFGLASIAQAALDDALQVFYVEALRVESLDTVAPPSIDLEHFDEEHGCTFTVTVEVRPEIEPADHVGISVTFPEWHAEPAAVDAQIDRVREQFAEVEVVERPAADGDLVTIDLRLSVDGRELEDARVEGALYEVGSGGVTPELDRRVVGAAAGDVLEYSDDLPAGYPEHGGSSATFHITVTDVREKRLPELDDDFADTAGGFDSFADLRADIERSLTRRRVLEGQHQLRGVVVDAYVALHEVPVPPAMLASSVEERLETLSAEATQFGGTLDELLALEGTSREEYETRLREQIQGMLTAQLVLDALARKLELTVQSSDVDQEFVRLATEHRMRPQEIAQLVQQQGTLSVLIGDVLRRKAIDLLVEAAEVSGGPGEELLVELGLAAAPVVEAEAVDGESSDEVVPEA
jgi:trigger factor